MLDISSVSAFDIKENVKLHFVVLVFFVKLSKEWVPFSGRGLWKILFRGSPASETELQANCVVCSAKLVYCLGEFSAKASFMIQK